MLIPYGMSLRNRCLLFDKNGIADVKLYPSVGLVQERRLAGSRVLLNPSFHFKFIGTRVSTMKIKHLSSIFGFAFIVILNGCSTTSPEQKIEQTAQPAPLMNDYPTRDRVEYVLNCVAQHGGLTYITQYACGCKIDKIAEKMTFAEYEAAKTFSYLRSTPGESGGVFRDPKQSKDLRKLLKEAEAYAERNCFVK